MKRFFIYCLLLCFLLTGKISYGVLPKEKGSRYEIENAGIGEKGYYLVKVWSYVQDPKKATVEIIKRNAVHGVIFRGFSGRKSSAFQSPMVKSSAIIEEKAGFFRQFLADDGDYIHYVDLIGVPEVVKIGKEYKVGYVVKVAKDKLRKVLEEAGVINKLSSAF